MLLQFSFAHDIIVIMSSIVIGFILLLTVTWRCLELCAMLNKNEYDPKSMFLKHFFGNRNTIVHYLWWNCCEFESFI